MSLAVVDFSDDGDQVLFLSAVYERLANKNDEEQKEGSLSEEFQQLLQNGNAREILDKLLSYQHLLWRADCTQHESVQALVLFASLVLKEDAEFVSEMTPRLLDAVTADPTTVPNIKIHACVILILRDESLVTRCSLASLYNLFDVKQHGFLIYSRLLEFAKATKLASEVVGDVPHLEARIKDWDTTKEQNRSIFKTTAEMLLQCPESKVSPLKYMKLYLATFDENDQALPEFKDATDFVKDITLVAIKECYKFDDILSTFVVQQMKEGENALYYRLIEIFAKEDVASFQQFCDANKDWVGKLGTSSDELLEKMRLVTLVSLCSAQQNLPFTKIASSLQIEESDVETWVIKAIAAGIINAKIDQHAASIMVVHSLLRSFGPAEWKTLQMRLNTWKENISTLSSVVQNAIQPPEAE